jgi:hypothetical protein
VTFDPSQLEIVYPEDAERIFEAFSLTEIVTLKTLGRRG